MSVGKRFLKGSSAALLASSLGGNFIPSNVYADGSSFTLDKKKFLEKKSNKEDNSSSSNGYLVAFKSTVACWWLKFCESSVFKYFFGKSSESKKVEEKVPETVVLSEEKVTKIKELASELEKKFGDKINLKPYENGEIRGTIVIGGWSYDLSVALDTKAKACIHVGKLGRCFLKSKQENNVTEVVEEFANWCNIIGETLEKLDDLVNARLFVKIVSKKTGVVILEPTYLCRVVLRDHDVRAIKFDPYNGNLSFFLDDNYKQEPHWYVSSGYELWLLTKSFNGIKINHFEKFNSIVSKILENDENINGKSNKKAVFPKVKSSSKTCIDDFMS